MNYLAHAFLAGPLATDRIGGVIGDFVKGPLPAGLDEALAAGVALHRRIDSFADGHPAFRRSRLYEVGRQHRSDLVVDEGVSAAAAFVLAPRVQEREQLWREFVRGAGLNATLVPGAGV